MATVTMLTGFALIADVVTTPDDAVTPDLILNPIQNQFYGVQPFPISATSNSFGVITFVIVSGPATINGNIVTITGVGLVTIQVNQTAVGNFLAGTVEGQFVVAPANPALTLNTIANQTYGVAPFTITSSTPSPSPVTYYIVSGPATITGSTITVTGAGTVVVGAAQPANGNYSASATTATFQVYPATATVVIAPINPGPVASGSTIQVVATSPQSSGTITLSILSGPATVSGMTITLTASSGAVTVEAYLAPTQNYTAAQATQSFEFGAFGFGESFGYFGSGL